MANDNALLKAQASLTQRDLILLGWLADHGVLTTYQIADALFPSLDFAQRRLLRLTRLGILDRFRPQKWNGGSHPYHYVLAQLGTEAAAAERGDDPPRRDQAKRRYHHLVSRANLPHLLGTNQFFIDLAAYARTHPGSSLLRWWPAKEFHDFGGFFRSGDDPGLISAGQLPRPDGHGIWAENGAQVPFFAEYDTGKERLEILILKTAAYERLAEYTTTWKWPVLIWLPTARRERNLHRALAGIRLRVVIATAAADHAAARGLTPADDVWWLIGRNPDDRRLRLAQLPFTDPDITNDTEMR